MYFSRTFKALNFKFKDFQGACEPANKWVRSSAYVAGVLTCLCSCASENRPLCASENSKRQISGFVLAYAYVVGVLTCYA